MSANPLDKQLVDAVLSRPRRAKADLEEAKMAGLRPSRAKAGTAVAVDDDDDDDDDWTWDPMRSPRTAPMSGSSWSPTTSP